VNKNSIAPWSPTHLVCQKDEFAIVDDVQCAKVGG
jgi:hypothetical protein